jgi:DNA gyrase/topoisomerase IV subunit B
LTKQKFDEFLSNHPDSAKIIAQIAEERFRSYIAQKKAKEAVPFGQEVGIGLTQYDLKNVLSKYT